MDIEEILQHGEEFRYMMLDRMRADCEYYLGNGGRHTKYLWGENEVDHIANMKALWKSFPEDGKPEWLSYEKIEEYEKKMCPEAILVERDYKGEHERFALTRDEFLSEYGEALRDNGLVQGLAWNTFALRPMVFISFREVTVGDDDWERFFADMEDGLAQGEIEEGNRAYIREDFFGELKKYLPVQAQSLEEKIQKAEKIGEKTGVRGLRPGARDLGRD